MVSGGSSLALLTAAPSARARASGYSILRPVDVTYLGAMLPAVIVQPRPEDVDEFLTSFERMLTPASPHTLGAIQDLIDLLTGTLTRPLMTLQLADWTEMSVEQVTSVLDDWSTSGNGLKRVAYGLTTSLVRTAWYMQAEQQLVSGYPGPPKKIVEPRTAAGAAS